MFTVSNEVQYWFVSMMLNLTSKSINLTIPTMNNQSKGFYGWFGCKPTVRKVQNFANVEYLA
jgi:hypothetical protein